ncbi:MAG TPA: glycosyltransferase family 4 protein, partial [Prolixibacteraceae bacterium]|jgi:glycosyltransferase involved in cell wall biosynthesis
MITQSCFPIDPRVRKEAEVLSHNGFSVDILCLQRDNEPSVEKFGLITTFRIQKYVRHESLIANLRVTLFFFFAAFIKLQLLSFKTKYDLIQIHNMPDFHVFAAFPQKLTGIPIILDLHDLTPELIKSKWKGRNKFLFNIVKLIEKLSCGFSDHLITVTEACKEILIERGTHSEKITLLLNTPDQNIFTSFSQREFNPISSGVRIIYHGTVSERFGLHIAIEALKIINDKIPGSHLTIFGKYEPRYLEYLNKLIDKLNLRENVHLEGGRSFEELNELIRESDLGIVPYIDDPYMNLALSTKLFEYNACGLPSVSSRLKSLSVIYNDESVAFTKPGDAYDLAEKIISLCSNPDKRKSMSINAYRILHEISWEKMSLQYLELINDQIQRTSVPVSENI